MKTDQLKELRWLQKENEWLRRGVHALIRSDNGPEFIAEIVHNWIAAVEATTAYIEPGLP